MPHRCLICERDFPHSDEFCHQCQLPLYDTTDTEHIQAIQLGRIMAHVQRRYEQARAASRRAA